MSEAGGRRPDAADRALLGSLVRTPELDAWLALREGRVLVRSGKAELGQGIRTALAAVAADELAVDPALIDVASPATGTTPAEGITAGSGSIEQSATAVRQACAHARRVLLARAADHLGVPADRLSCEGGLVRSDEGRSVSYWELVGEAGFGVTVDRPTPTVAPAERRFTGRGLPRIDLAAKVRGEPAFLHDLGLVGERGAGGRDPVPGPLRHARVIRPGWAEHELARPVDAAELAAAGTAAGSGGDVDVVVDGSFVAVVADREGDAVLAADAVAPLLSWREPPPQDGDPADPARMTRRVESSSLVVDGAITDRDPGPPLAHAGSATTLDARYVKPFLLHGSIGPSAAVARSDGSELEVWTHSQGVELLRPSIAEALGLPVEDVTVRHVDGAGCYGHNGADDAAFDAAVISLHRPGSAVRVQWSRADEHRLEPASPAMTVDLGAGLDGEGRIRSWSSDGYSYSHVGRPFPQGSEVSGLLAAWSRADARRRPAPMPGFGFHGGPHRNADPLYEVGERRVASHLVGGCPVRTSSTRSLGAFANVFAIESFMDELALAAGVAPDRFRVQHLGDPRAVEVVEAVVDAAGGLEAPGGLDAPGRGLGFARYENVKAHVAVVAEVTVDPRSGSVTLHRGWIAADAGEVIDPDGLANQLEGGFVQAASWTLREELAVEDGRVTAADWESYPILRFSEAPRVETRLLHRPDEPVLGAAEAVTGPTPAAIANAVFQATGARLRRLPLTPQRVLAELDALAGAAEVDVSAGAAERRRRGSGSPGS